MDGSHNTHRRFAGAQPLVVIGKAFGWVGRGQIHAVVGRGVHKVACTVLMIEVAVAVVQFMGDREDVLVGHDKLLDVIRTPLLELRVHGFAELLVDTLVLVINHSIIQH